MVMQLLSAANVSDIEVTFVKRLIQLNGITCYPHLKFLTSARTF